MQRVGGSKWEQRLPPDCSGHTDTRMVHRLIFLELGVAHIRDEDLGLIKRGLGWGRAQQQIVCLDIPMRNLQAVQVR